MLARPGPRWPPMTRSSLVRLGEAVEDLPELGDLVLRAADRGRDGVRADLGLPAAAVAAVAGLAGRVEAQVPDLAGVAARALEPPPAGDDAGTDADVAGDVDQVVDPDADAALVLGQGAEVGVVGERDRDVESEGGEHDRAERDVVPLEVGGQPHQAVAAPHQARDADPDPDQRCGRPAPRDDLADQARAPTRRPARPRPRRRSAPGHAAGRCRRDRSGPPTSGRRRGRRR